MCATKFVARAVRLFATLAVVSVGFFSGGSSAAAISDSQLFALRKLPEPLVPTSVDETGQADNDALLASLTAYEKRGQRDDFSALEGFLSSHPKSRWKLAVETNLGLLYYHAGYFSKCIPAFEDAWETGKGATDLKASALADRAAGEYTNMLSRLGRYPELKEFLKEIEGRQFTGHGAQMVVEGKENALTMEKRPEISFRCGPLALSRILASEKSPLAISPEIFNSKSTMEGISLSDVAALSKKLGMNYQPAKRSPGAPLIFPSVIHWKVGHYAALIKQSGALFLTDDATFKSTTWHTREALEAEASGYFLVPPGPLPAGWTAVSQEEASQVFGKGLPSGSNGNATCPGDKKNGGGPKKGGPCNDNKPTKNKPPKKKRKGRHSMAEYEFHLMLASLTITDTPVGYDPPFGDTIDFTVTYCQREASQPANFTYSNLGPQWNYNWLSYITDDPTNPQSDVTQAVAEGGTYPYTYNGVSGNNYVFNPQFDSYQVLSRPTGGLPYTISYPDGSSEVYGQSDGSTSYPRKVFLTQRIDAMGNVTTLNYDNQLRIQSITDPLGRQMTFSYGNADIYKITEVTDPFGRSAIFNYDNNGRLILSQDVSGIQSQFTYDGSSDFINSMTTPYGKTTFTTTEENMLRRLTATDPAGDTEVLEVNGNITQATLSEDETLIYPIPPIDPSAPVGLTNVTVNYNTNLYYRNSFYWDRKQWKEHPNDHSMAYIYHWLHDTDLTMSRDLESEKPPLENRVWYAYPGQTIYNVVGTQSTPMGVGRVVEGGSQISQIGVNSIGNCTTATDSLGRQTTYNYAANGIDLASMTHQPVGGGAVQTLSSFTWNSQHLPLTITDPAGQTTTYTWNAQGNMTSVTNPLKQTTTYTYYTADASGHQRNGRLYQMIGALPGGTDVTTYDYDGFGRLASLTTPDGYSLSFSYDALDRLTQVTYPDGTSDKTTYFAMDPQTQTDRLGRVTSFVYNDLQQMASMTDPANRTTHYTWCRCGALSQIVDPMGRTTTWHYDDNGRVTARIYPDGSTSTFTYTPYSGLLQTTTDSKGQVLTASYNLDDTLASMVYTNALAPTPTVSFTYDPDYMRVTSMTDGTGTTTFTYNPISAGVLGAGQLATETTPLPNSTIGYSYDALGRRTGYTVNGVGESMSFDKIGRIQSTTSPLGTLTPSYFGPTARLKSVTLPNGVVCAYTYQPVTGDDLLQSITHTLPGGSTLLQNTYQYNAEDEISQWTQSFPQGNISRQWVSTLDSVDQLKSIEARNPQTLQDLSTGQYSFTYDPAGNRLSTTLDGNTTTAGFNATDQLASLSGSGAAVQPAQTYTWDAEDRLVAINYTGTNKSTQFQYDGLGRRVRITEMLNGSATADTRFVWSGTSMKEARDTTGKIVQKRYFPEGVQVVTGSTTASYYYAMDHLGSIRAMTDSTGKVRAGYDYDVHGVRTKLLGDLDSDFGYAGLYTHVPSQLDLAVFRAYNPLLGRFISRDPIEQFGGPNLYAYSMDDPIDGNDMLGFSSSVSAQAGNISASLGPNGIDASASWGNFTGNMSSYGPPTGSWDTGYGKINIPFINPTQITFTPPSPLTSIINMSGTGGIFQMATARQSLIIQRSVIDAVIKWGKEQLRKAPCEQKQAWRNAIAGWQQIANMYTQQIQALTQGIANENANLQRQGYEGGGIK